MMTFYTVLQLIEQYGIDPEMTLITVSRTAASVKGTSAELREGDMLTMTQLFYGMMLPSGNDAAFAFAEYFGELLKEKKYSGARHENLFKDQVSNFSKYPFLKYFLREMNLNASKLKMSDSFYDSPHGLKNNRNFATAYDICHLVTECMKIPIFWKVVSTPYYETRAYGNDAADRNYNGSRKTIY